MNNIFFKMPSHIYAAQTDGGIILLNATQDKYLSIAGSSAEHFKAALEKPIFVENNTYSCATYADDQESFDQSIQFFLEQKFIEPCDKLSETHIKKAIQPGGLVDYQWDRKEQLVSSSQAEKLLTLKFLFLVMQVDFILRRRGINGILKKIETYKNKNNYIQPTPEQIEMLSNALDRACSFYPKKLFCLAWSSAFVLMALKKGYKANLVIGVQSPPFYAHAWAEVGNCVINDDPMIQSRLAVILTVPFK